MWIFTRSGFARLYKNNYKVDLLQIIMDCRDVVVEIAQYFAEGYRREGFMFFTRDYKELSDRLRDEYFHEERESMDYFRHDAPTRPRTPDFVEAVKFECMNDERNGSGFFSFNGTGIEDPYDIVGRALNKLRRMGYRHLIDGEV